MSSFRIIPSYPGDLGKSHIRIAKDQMKRLEVSNGDVVHITGARSTAAICLLDDKVLSHDPEFEFLYDVGKRLPVVRLSDIVSRNARDNNLLYVVHVKKVKATKAKKVTLSVREIFSYRKENLFLQDLEGMPFTKDDIIRIANAESETKFPFIEFVVVDAKPDADVYIITENTKIEFAPYKTRISSVPKMSNLKRTIPLGKKVSDKRLEIKLESIEVYDEGCGFFLDISYSFDDPREWLENKMYALVSASDDMGNLYRCVKIRSVESHWSDGSPQYNKLSGILVPSINDNASKLVFEINEITWQIRQEKDLQHLEQINSVIKEEPSIVSIWQPQKQFYMIAEGPWKFDVYL